MSLTQETVCFLSANNLFLLRNQVVFKSVSLKKALFILFFVLACLTAYCRQENHAEDMAAIEKVFAIADSVCGMQTDTCLNIYTKYEIDIKRRNFILSLLPSMHAISRGERNYHGEKLCRMIMSNGDVENVKFFVSAGNIPRNKNVVSIMKILLMPKLYGETIFSKFLLSPFNRKNKGYYRYKVMRLPADKCIVYFNPRFRNVQLVSGQAIIDSAGYISEINFKGVLDMVKFQIVIRMQDVMRYLPDYGGVKLKMSFVGNRILSDYEVFYGAFDSVPDGLDNSHDQSVMDSLRPRITEQKRFVSFPIFKFDGDGGASGRYQPIRRWQDFAGEAKVEHTSDSTAAKDVNERKSSTSGFFKTAGNYLLERLNGSFGSNRQGAYRISPIINPLYLGYSNRKGITYRIKLNGTYAFTSDMSLTAVVKLGYSFKLRQLYTSIPVRLNITKRLYAETEFGTGNHIASSEILNQLKHETYDSVRWDRLNLDLFKDMYWKFRVGYDITSRITIRPGLSYHKREAVDKDDFSLMNKPSEYFSFAPTLQLVFSPWGAKGPVATCDYERGIKGVMRSDMDYERIETDLSWKISMRRLRVLSARVGYGLYTSRSRGAYFLDYSNFKYNSIPDGWDDDWTGEFQLLNQNWYNASKYYFRNNLTYESPLLLLSRIPFVGKFIETERLYGNMLFTDKLHPYVELGYGLTNRLFSVGLFSGVSNKTFAGAGVRFSLELFRDW